MICPECGVIAFAETAAGRLDAGGARVPRRGLPEISYHLLILLAGLVVAALALVVALAVGPYGQRGVRFTSGFIALAAFVGSAAWLAVYLGMVEQRRAIEERIAALRAQAMASGPLACLERGAEALQASCAHSLFASPGAISSAGIYTASRLDAMKAARHYSGPRTPQFDDVVVALERSLQEDPFGLAADILVRREGCTAQRCEALSLFADPARLADNIRNKTFDANVARYTAAWSAPQPAAPQTAGSSAPVSAPASTITPSGLTRAPIPDKYELPSAASIPPVSIMTEEPPQRATPAPAAKDRPAAPAQEAAAPAAETATPPVQAETPPAAQKKSAPRRPTQQNAPLSIAPPR
ncbi:MAG: hypothetical protein QOH67_1614 [Hyphomicrobiales bacterium]|nr:hypothetical protein [Hyphomicrobiales bacterium]